VAVPCSAGEGREGEGGERRGLPHFPGFMASLPKEEAYLLLPPSGMHWTGVQTLYTK
jgi:hypothetical protein